MCLPAALQQTLNNILSKSTEPCVQGEVHAHLKDKKKKSPAPQKRKLSRNRIELLHLSELLGKTYSKRKLTVGV